MQATCFIPAPWPIFSLDNVATGLSKSNLVLFLSGFVFQVLVADDTVIMNRYFAPSLLYTLQENPNSIITPHKDLFMSMRIYTMYADKKMHPDSQIWQETTFGEPKL